MRSSKTCIAMANALLFFVLSVGIMSFLLSTLNETRQVLRWPVTQGSVVSAAVEDAGSTRGHRYARVRVEYVYSANGVQHTGTQFSKHGESFPASEAQSIVDELLTNRSVDVFFDPSHPDDAVLYRNDDGTVLLLVGAVVSGAYALFVLLHIATKLRSCR